MGSFSKHIWLWCGGVSIVIVGIGIFWHAQTTSYLDLVSVWPVNGATVKQSPGVIICGVKYVNPTDRTMDITVFPIVDRNMLPGTGSRVIEVAPKSSGTVEITCELMETGMEEKYPDGFNTNGLRLKMSCGDSFSVEQIRFEKIVPIGFVWVH